MLFRSGGAGGNMWMLSLSLVWLLSLLTCHSSMMSGVVVMALVVMTLVVVVGMWCYNLRLWLWSFLMHSVMGIINMLTVNKSQ